MPTIDLRLVLLDVNAPNTPTAPLVYDVSTHADSLESLAEELHTYGQGSQISVHLWSTLSGVAIAVQPVAGMEVGFYAKDFYGANLHKYLFFGKITIIEPIPTIENKDWIIHCDGFDDDLSMPIPSIKFDQATFPTDGTRITELFAQATARFGLRGTWDATGYVSGSLLTYPVGNAVEFAELSIAEIVEQIEGDVGDPSVTGYPVAPRRHFISGVWTNPSTPGVGGITRIFNYYSGTQAPTDTLPLTDAPDGKADHAFDDFARAASTTSMGKAPSGQTWAALVGTWGIDATGHAYLQAHVAQDIAIMPLTISDGRPRVRFSTTNAAQRLAFRVTSLPATAWKWEGFIFQNGGPDYSIWRFQAGAYTLLATYPVTPANGDILEVELSGSTITPYINGVAKTPITSTFNQTANLYGISADVISAARWDDFSVRGQSAAYFDFETSDDTSAMNNIVAIAGPGSFPEAVNWRNLTNAASGGDGDITKSLLPDVWGPAQSVTAGDYRRATALTEKQFRCTIGGTTHATTEPTWNTTEGATTTESTGVQWITETWNAGGVSTQPISDDGGQVTATIEELWKVEDGFDRGDNLTSTGQTPTGEAWGVLAPGGNASKFGIQSGRAYQAVSGAGAATYDVVDAKISTCVVEVKLPVNATGARLMFRAKDISNLFFVEAQATTYKIYRRQTGSDNQILSYTATPAAGDVVKVALQGDLIRFYLNGTWRADVTDAFQLGATIHGFGTNGSTVVPRFDDFKIHQTRSTMSFGVGPATTCKSYVTHAHGWLFGADGSANVVEAGVLKGSPTTYIAADVFSVEVRPIPLAAGGTEIRVKYYKNGALYYESAVHPTVTEAAPFYAQAALWHSGATVSNVTIQRFTYGIYSDAASVAKWGPKPLKGVIQRDDLDTQAKRKAHANAIFARRGQPRQVIKVSTLQEYTAGHIVLFNNSRLWTNYPRVIASIERQWSTNENLDYPLYVLTLGDADIEYGDDEPLGYMTQNQYDDRTAPPTPTGFAATSGGRDGRQLVYQRFIWDAPSHGERYVEIEIQRVGGQVISFTRWPAAASSVVVGGLPETTPVFARIRAIDYNGNASRQWSAAVPFSTATLPRLAPPTNTVPAEQYNFFDPSSGMTNVQIGLVAPSDPLLLGLAGYHLTLTQGAYMINLITAVVVSALFAMMPGEAYTIEQRSIDSYGLESLSATFLTGTAAPAIMVGLPNPSFEVPDRYDGTLPRYYTRGGDHDATATLDTTQHADGARSVKLVHGTVAAGDKGSINSSFFVLPGSTSDTKRLRIYAKGQSGGELLGLTLVYYDSTFTPLSNLFLSTAITASWEPYEVLGLVAANAVYGQARFSEDDVGTAAKTIWVDNGSVDTISGTRQSGLMSAADKALFDFQNSAPVTKTATFTADATARTYICNSASAITANLPAASGIAGREYTFINIAAGKVTIDGSGSETIDNITTYPLQGGRNSVTIFCTGAGWYVTNQSGLILQSDGTRWLGVEQVKSFTLRTPATAAGMAPIIATLADAPVGQVRGVQLVRLDITSYVLPNNNGSNYWTYTFFVDDGAGTRTNLGSANSSGHGANNWKPISISSFSSNNFAAGAQVTYNVDTGFTGTPGNLYPAFDLHFREIYV